MLVLTCAICGGEVAFGPEGWDHCETDRACPRLQVAWPAPRTEDD